MLTTAGRWCIWSWGICCFIQGLWQAQAPQCKATQNDDCSPNQITQMTTHMHFNNLHSFTARHSNLTIPLRAVASWSRCQIKRRNHGHTTQLFHYSWIIHTRKILYCRCFSRVTSVWKLLYIVTIYFFEFLYTRWTDIYSSQLHIKICWIVESVIAANASDNERVCSIMISWYVGCCLVPTPATGVSRN